MVDSISYIKGFVEKLKNEGEIGVSKCYHIAPNIDSKKLTNATTKIAKQIDPSTVLGIYDSTVFESAKEGLVFTGNKLFISYAFCKYEITLDQVEIATYHREEVEKENNKIEIKEYLVVDNKDGSNTKIQKYQCPLGLKIIEEFLNGVVETITDFKEVKQNIILQDLNDEIIETYLSIVTTYLYTDDMQIDEIEYKQLITLMSQIKISKPVAMRLRDIRLNPTIEELNMERLINKLHIQLDEYKIDQMFINQALYLDLLSIRNTDIEENSKNPILLECKPLLKITDDHVKCLIQKIEGDQKIVNERLDNNQVKEVTDELIAVAGSSGVVLGALLLTGGVSTGIWGGLMTLALASTGGLALGLVAIGGLSFGAYKGLKYFSGTSEAEKYGVRLSTLQTIIENNKNALTYVIEDVNWITGKMREITDKMKTSDDQTDCMMDELMGLINKSSSISSAGQNVEKDNDKYSYEINICSIPMELNYDKFMELIKNNYKADSIIEKVLSIYTREEKMVNDKLVVTYNRALEIEYDMANEIYKILNDIGMFNTMQSGQAQLQAVAKKGFNSMKNFLGN